MLQHIFNVSYLLYGFALIAINPILTTVFLALLYMRGELGPVIDMLLVGFTSLGAISVYIIPFAMAGALVYAMFKNVAKHP